MIGYIMPYSISYSSSSSSTSSSSSSSSSPVSIPKPSDLLSVANAFNSPVCARKVVCSVTVVCVDNASVRQRQTLTTCVPLCLTLSPSRAHTHETALAVYHLFKTLPPLHEDAPPTNTRTPTHPHAHTHTMIVDEVALQDVNEVDGIQLPPPPAASVLVLFLPVKLVN